MNFTYNKHEKLKSEKAIGKLFTEGKSVSAYPLRMVYLKTEDSLKTGVSVSKRNFKTAVARNKIKRLMREAYRLNKNLLIDNNADNYTLMILYIGKEMPDFKLVNIKTKALFEAFLNKTSKN